MDERTITALEALDGAFYRGFARAFSESRGTPWPGWGRVLDLARVPRGGVILDAGCGNGRFGRACLAAGLQDARYVGLDRCPELLAEAALPPTARLHPVDLLRDPWEALLPAPAHLAVAFGLLHHIPGEGRRRRLVERLAATLAPGGLLALTFWRFLESPRLAKKVLPASELPAALAGAALEPGDCLLSWDRGGHGVRYAHHATAAEIEGLVGATGLRTVADYLEDGEGRQMNRYLVLQR